MIKRLASYIAIFGSLSLLAILLFDVVIMPGYVRMNDGRYMVNVTGKTLQHAIKVLESEGYNGLVSDTLYSATYEAGTIVDQYPLPNTRVKEGRTVRLKIAHLERMVSIPDLIGRSIRSAELMLTQSGLEIDTVYKEFNSDVPSGNVTWQYPKGGDLLNKGMGLHLTVSLGVPPNFFQVPNLFGLSKKKAVNDLTKSRILCREIILSPKRRPDPIHSFRSIHPCGNSFRRAFNHRFDYKCSGYAGYF